MAAPPSSHLNRIPSYIRSSAYHYLEHRLVGIIARFIHFVFHMPPSRLSHHNSSIRLLPFVYICLWTCSLYDTSGSKSWCKIQLCIGPRDGPLRYLYVIERVWSVGRAPNTMRRYTLNNLVTVTKCDHRTPIKPPCVITSRAN